MQTRPYSKCTPSVTETERARGLAHSQAWRRGTCLADRDDDSRGSFQPPSLISARCPWRRYGEGEAEAGGGLSEPREDAGVWEMETVLAEKETQTDRSRRIGYCWIQMSSFYLGCEINPFKKCCLKRILMLFQAGFLFFIFFSRRTHF